jgi:hypothetical protein
MTDTLQERVLAATNGTQTGAILRCAFNKNGPGETPRFEGRASVTSDGFVMCNFVDAGGRGHHSAFVGSMADLNDNLVRLSDHLRLDAAEDEELMDAVDNWIANDYRYGATSDRFVDEHAANENACEDGINDA